jgi:hypothetical protein
MADRVRPDSFSQAVMAEPQSTQGNPLAMPKMKMVRIRRSRYSLKLSRKDGAALSGSGTSPVVATTGSLTPASLMSLQPT